MLRRLFARPSAAAPDPTTGEVLIYAVGDIHGRLDLLDRLLEAIRRDAVTTAPGRRPTVIFIGDYVDRGPDSKGVIARLIALGRDPGLTVRTLKGNHEEQLLSFLQHPRAGPPWLEFGGADTLLSYGIAPPASRTDLEVWDQVRREFLGALPPEHAAFLQGLELAVTCGDYVFVHAGVRPGVPLSSQSERDLLWIREDFLNSERPCDKVVVHGHTPEASPYIGRHRIGIDTGAYATGTLTSVRLLGAEREILQVGPGAV